MTSSGDGQGLFQLRRYHKLDHVRNHRGQTCWFLAFTKGLLLRFGAMLFSYCPLGQVLFGWC